MRMSVLAIATIAIACSQRPLVLFRLIVLDPQYAIHLQTE
jgi:hypothetical protein